MKNWTIGKRIVAISGLLIALLLVISTTAYLSLRTVRSQATAIRDDNVTGLVNCGLINASFEDSFIRTLLAGQADTADARESFIKEQEALSPLTGEAIKKYETSVFEDTDRQLINTLKDKRARYGEIRTQ